MKRIVNSIQCKLWARDASLTTADLLGKKLISNLRMPLRTYLKLQKVLALSLAEGLLDGDEATYQEVAEARPDCCRLLKGQKWWET